MNHRNFSNHRTFLALLMLVIAATSFSVWLVFLVASWTTLADASIVFCSFCAAWRFWLKYLHRYKQIRAVMSINYTTEYRYPPYSSFKYPIYLLSMYCLMTDCHPKITKSTANGNKQLVCQRSAGYSKHEFPIRKYFSVSDNFLAATMNISTYTNWPPSISHGCML